MSPHIGFYKSFGRPVAKVFLGAVFTYQITYIAWVKLNVEDVKDRKNGTLHSLEVELQKLKE